METSLVRGGERYEITNNGQNICAVKQRIENLRKLQLTIPVEFEVLPAFDGDGRDVQITEIREDNRIQILFSEKPAEELRNRMTKSGFRWPLTKGIWQQYIVQCAILQSKDFACAFIGESARVIDKTPKELPSSESVIDPGGDTTAELFQ